MEEAREGEGTFSLRARVRLAAEAVLEFAEPCYGPRGLAKAIQQSDGSVRVLASGASALREVAPADPDVQPYADLAGAVQEHAGDQATASLLLAARMIRNACNGIEGGVPAAAYLDGYSLALRQARATLSSIAAPDPAADSLKGVVPGQPGLAALVAEGLQRLGKGRDTLPLDAIDVVAEGASASWLPGVLVRPQRIPRAPPTGEVRVLLLSDDWRPGTFKEGMSYKMTAKHTLGVWSANEDAMRAEALGHLQGLGVGLVVCHREVEAGLADMCESAGIFVWNDAPASAMQRIERAVSAQPVARLAHAQRADLGKGKLEKRDRRLGGWLLVGKGPSATLLMPAENELAKAQARDDGERLLRCAGAWLREPEAVPGGGRWQRVLAKSLRSAADAAPGKSPLGMRAAADALDAVADALVRNLGLDPLAMRLPPDAAGIVDPALCVRVALVGAVEMAIQVLRVDDRYAKKPTSTAGLRGGEGKPMTVREMAGDVPPLM
ncbi:MAG: TCP-1/cpn60 chaperonin family protein [bacterium]